MMHKIHDLLNRFRDRGIVNAGELLLYAEDAVHLAEELADLGVPIIGIDLWYRVGDALAEDPYGCDFSDILQQPDAVAETTRRTIDFIRHLRSSKAEMISLVIDDQGWWQDQVHEQS
jgi:hypothetical protein